MERTNGFGSGEQLGLAFSYAEQPEPKGLAQAFLIAEDFISGQPSCLILGDNIFYGHGLLGPIHRATDRENGATIFGYWVNDPERYGVVEFDESNTAISIEEKPASPKSNCAVTGMYFYPKGVAKYVKTMQPSTRGELEITDVNKHYLKEKSLRVSMLGRGYAWLDTGTFDSLLEAGEFIATVERRQGLKIACIEEIAYGLGWISQKQLLTIANRLSKNSYGKYLTNLV